jgi:hypothetical protein
MPDESNYFHRPKSRIFTPVIWFELGILFHYPVSPSDRLSSRTHSSSLHSSCIHALSPPCPVTGGNQQHKALIDEVRADATKLTPGQAAAVKALWADAGIQVCARGGGGQYECHG